MKEDHGEIGKSEPRILWGDYFRPEQVETYPDLHTTVGIALKLGGRRKHKVGLGAKSWRAE